MHIALAPLFALASFTASGASTVAGGDQAGPVQAGGNFRIVIPETLHVGSQAERLKRSQTIVSRTTQQQEGRTLVTVARP